MADCGVRLLFVVQSLAQLQGRYPSGWQTLIANTGAMTFWSNSDPVTLSFLSEKVGMTSLELHRLLERDTQHCLVLAAGRATVFLQRYNSAHDPTFAGRVDA